MKQVYFYPSYTSPQCVLVLERVNFKSSGWGILGHIPLTLALDLHKNWEWLSHEDYARFNDGSADPTLYHLFAKTEFQREFKYHSNYPTLEAARAAEDKLKKDPYEFIASVRIEYPSK